MNARLTAAERLDLAESLWETGQLEDALSILAGEDAVDPNVYALRGEIEFAMGRFQEAALSYTALVTAEPNCGDGHYNLGLALLRTQKWEGAAAAFQRALRLDRNRPDAWAGLGVCLLEECRPDDALEAFERARSHGLAGEAAWAQACFGRAAALHLLGRLEEARAAYESLLDAGPQRHDVISNLVALTAALGDVNALDGYARRLLELDPHSVVALKGLAALALSLADYQSLARYCDQIMEVAPGSPDAAHNFSFATDWLLKGLRSGIPADPSAAGRQ
jgi:tetratricopeptide (TPR) repeat protein